MIDSVYKNTYTNIFRTLLAETPAGYYDHAAVPSYTHSNKLMAWLFWQRIKIALSMAGKLERSSVLDFGCGCGVTFLYLRNKKCRITGCDSQFYSITDKVCKELNIQATIHSDIDNICDEKFDCIVALDVLEHIKDQAPYIEKLKQLSHNGTRIILSGPTENMLYKIGRRMAGFSGDYHVSNIYDIEKNFQKHGLQRIALRRLYFPFTLFRISCWSIKQHADSRVCTVPSETGVYKEPDTK